MAVFDSQNTWFKSKIGPIQVGRLQLKVCLERDGYIEDVCLVLTQIGNHQELRIPMQKLAEESTAIIYSITCSFEQCSTYEYYFEFTKNGKKYYVRRKWFEFIGYVTEALEDFPWRLTVYDKITTHPLMKKGIMYQIFPDRFMKGEVRGQLPKDRIYRNWGENPYYDQRIGEDFFGGNFNGISEKIGYLKKLYVDIVYSNPICYSSKNHRYATIDYKEVDPVLGTEEEFVDLVDGLHKNGMLFVLDAVFNHVGSDSIYFDRYNKQGTDGAYNNEKSPFKDWFFIDEQGKYSSWWNDPSIPKLNYASKSLREYILGNDGVLKHWYKNWKIDGIREDVADELSNEVREKMFDISEQERGDNKIVIVEVWEDASNKWAYSTFMKYLQGHQTTSVMNYPIRDLLLAYVRYGGDWAMKFKVVCNEIFKENYPREIAYSLMNFISTHDTVRGITKLAGPEVNGNSRQWQAEHNHMSREEYILGRKRLLLAYTLIFFLPGIPSIYYGDEVGMQGMPDPYCRGCFPWERIDKKILRAFKRLCAVRHKYRDFLAEAEFDIITAEEKFFVFERTFENKRIRIALNFSQEERNITELFSTRRIENGRVLFEVEEPKIIFQVNVKNSNAVVRKNSDNTTQIVLSGLDAIVYQY